MKKYSAKVGYDRVARDYADWYWTRFWQTYEAPIVRPWLEGRSGLGIDLGAGFGPYKMGTRSRLEALRTAEDKGWL